ncbi:MAG: hypothetical protein ABI824_10910, partial [Acidobacteriota bacterium]
RVASHCALIASLLIGWFVNPPFPFPLEDNLSVVDFVRLQEDAAHYLEGFPGNPLIATVWPLSVATKTTDYGYVSRPLNVIQASSQHAADLAKLDLDHRLDIVVLFSRGGSPPAFMLSVHLWRNLIARFNDLHPQASGEEMTALGFRLQQRFEGGEQWVEIYLRNRR